MSGENETQTRRRTPKTEEPVDQSQVDPRIEHMKLLAQRERDRKERNNTLGTFYTLNGTKIVRVIVKPSGTYTVYVGNTKKMPDFAEKAKKKGNWVDPLAAKEHEDKLRAGK